MSEKIIYRPYRTLKVFGYIMLSISMISLGIIVLGHLSAKEVCIFLVELCFSFFLACYCLLASKVTIVFDIIGISIINDKKTKLIQIPWDELFCAFYTRNYKGHQFLVLSSSVLSREDARKLANKGANLSKTFLKRGTVVVYLDGVHDVPRIKQIVENNISLVLEEY